MNLVKGFVWPRATKELLNRGVSRYSILKKQRCRPLDAEEVRPFYVLPQRREPAAVSLQQSGFSGRDLNLGERLSVSKYLMWNSVLPCCCEGNVLQLKQHAMNICRRYASSVDDDPSLSRDFLVKLWVEDKKMKNSKAKKKLTTSKFANDGKSMFDNAKFSLQKSLGKWISSESVTDGKSYDPEKPLLKQPPTSQRVTGRLKPASQDEAQVATLLARSTLLITRDIEWANLMLGFEQENRYGIVDVFYPQSPVGLIREQSSIIARQLLRTRRPFVAYITDALGNELFRVRRPFWWINSSIYAEINGKEVGVVHKRWHLWRRIYDLYLGNEQFAVVENPGFWNWTFTLKDINGEVLAQIDRDWRGFGFELFTDAGQYVIRFGSSDTGPKIGPTSLTDELHVARPLTLSERAVAVALAVSLDNDYFSRHGGWGIPFVAMEE